jgi:hypothetical protein
MALPSPLPLAKPPIVEAILDIQVAFPHAVDVNQLRELGTALQSDYPQLREQFQATVNFEQLPATQRINDYFNFGTKDPHEDTLLFLSFISNQFFIDLKTGFGANLNTASQHPEGGRLPVILDIDVSEQRLDQIASSDPFSILTTMREVKNRLFLRSLTPEALKVFE